MEQFSIRDEIVEVVNKLFVYTDMQEWDKLQSEVFAMKVLFDMSSLGGEKLETTPNVICETWKSGFADIDAVNHLAGNYLVQISDANATVFAYATATHYKASATREKTREFVGTYDIALTKEGGAWRINQFVYNLKFITGNADLV